MQVCLELEKQEHERLSPQAAFSDESKGRPCPQITKEGEVRTNFQRDTDRIVHCKSFRRLMHKTQVFLQPEGDHYRTRMTHTIEVARIARTITRALHLNEDLAEAIAMGHDLGHTPFGHAGEGALTDCLGKPFRHNEQSLRVVDILENNGSGLNLSYEVRMGILGHTGDRIPETMEGQIVRRSDQIAYVNHDIDDAMRAGILSEQEIPHSITHVLGQDHSSRIDTLVSAMIAASGEGTIAMDPAIEPYFWDIHAFMYEYLYLNSKAKVEETKVDGMLSAIFEYFYKNPDKLPEEYALIRERDGTARAVCDYIAGMTDNFALEMYHELYVPRGWAMTLR